MKYGNNQRLVYKIKSEEIKRSGFSLDFDFEKVMLERPELVVAVGDSQCFRFIDLLRGRGDGFNNGIISLKKEIAVAKKQGASGRELAVLKKKLTAAKFNQDLVMVVMNSASDYDRINKRGLIVNGMKYRRLLGTSGGVKQSTIIYVADDIHDELMRRITNGRDLTREFIPAKLEAYQALVCSASTPIPQPNGVIVVRDCVTHFSEDVIHLERLGEDDEPTETVVEGFEFEHDASDGFGLISPAYAVKVNRKLNGSFEPISGFNVRNSWTKGMLFAFDFVEFAREVAGSYFITDVWGAKRDVRECEMILTESMLKLWDSYTSWEHYADCCLQNGWEFSATKTTVEEVERERKTNYQFLQSYELTDGDIDELVAPSVEEIKAVLGGDWRASVLYLAGKGLSERNCMRESVPIFARCLMVEPHLVCDDFVRKAIKSMMDKRICDCKKGVLKIRGNYVMISGDPYALCQSMFGLEVTGLLSAGECYHEWWAGHNVEEVAVFRAPMTCHNNIRRLRVRNSDDCKRWYRYISAVLILNAWDSTCEALNGADFDGDTALTTDNPVLLRNVKNEPTIVCVQKKGNKKVPTEDDIIAGNKIAFNDDIGTITNHITAMFDIQSQFSKDSREYQALAYRIRCGQLYQQESIDRIKGIEAAPMPPWWYSHRGLADGDQFNRSISATAKPYFMCYVYPRLAREFKNYRKDADRGAMMRYGVSSIEDLRGQEEYADVVKWYDRLKPVTEFNCVVNRIARKVEGEFGTNNELCVPEREFDWRILRSGKGYDIADREKIKAVYKSYIGELAKRKLEKQGSGYEIDDLAKREVFNEVCRAECLSCVESESQLCDLLLDMCYGEGMNRQFVWDICGETILHNLLLRNNYLCYCPVEKEDGDLDFCGTKYGISCLEVCE